MGEGRVTDEQVIREVQKDIVAKGGWVDIQLPSRRVARVTPNRVEAVHDEGGRFVFHLRGTSTYMAPGFEDPHPRPGDGVIETDDIG